MAHPMRAGADIEAFRKVVTNQLRAAQCAMQSRRSVPLGVFVERKEWVKLERALEELSELAGPVRKSKAG